MNQNDNYEAHLKVIYDLTMVTQSGNYAAKAIGIKGNSVENYTAKTISECKDIYEMIDNIDQDKLQTNYDIVSFLTTGWAAPLSSNGEIEGKPSEHKDRRRVTLITAIDVNAKDIIGSIIDFEDSDELVFDNGNATGSLAEAMLGLVQ